MIAIIGAPPEEYDVQDQAQMRRQIEAALTSLTSSIQAPSPVVTGCELSFTDVGALHMKIECNSETNAFRYAVSTTATPSAETARAAAVQVGYQGTFEVVGPYAAGSVVYVTVLAYSGRNGDGIEGKKFTSQAARSTLVYSLCGAQVTDVSPSTITVTVTSSATGVSTTPTVQLLGVTGSCTVASCSVAGGEVAGTEVPSGTSWIFNRGAALGPSGQAQFRSTLSNTVSDDDYVEINEIGRDTVNLQSRARALSTSATTVVVRVAVAAPNTTGGLAALITYQSSGVGTVTPASGGTVTPTASILTSEAAGTYIDYTITRPVSGSPPGMLTFTATCTGYTSDTDVISIPAQDTTYSMCLARITATDATTITVTVSATSPLGTPTVQYVGVTGNVTKASGAAAGVACTQNGTDNVWVFNRGSFGGGTGMAEFEAVLAGAVSDSDSITLNEIGRDTVYLTTRARVTSTSATQVVVRFAVADPYPQGSGSATITYQDLGSGGVTPASGGTVTPASTLSEVSGTYVDYTITRPASGSGTGRVTFTATASNRTSDSDSVDIPPQERTTFGGLLPSISIVTTPSATAYSIVVTYTGTCTVSLDGAAPTSVSASPATISAGRATVFGGDHVYAFTVTRDSQTVSDSVVVPAQIINECQCHASVYATTATTTTIKVTATATNGTPAVQYLGVVGGTGALYSGHSIADGAQPQNGTDNLWVFTRGAINTGDTVANFRATLSGAGSDDDGAYVTEQGRDTILLKMLIEEDSSSNSSYKVYNVYVADPFPGSSTATITYTTQGLGTVSPTSGGTVTPASTFTRAAGTYIQYTIPRPAFGSDRGQISFLAHSSLSNRTDDSDSQGIRPIDKLVFGPTLAVNATPYATTYDITWSGDNVQLSIDGASFGTPPSSPITVSRNAAGGVDKVYTFNASLDGQTIPSTVIVPAQSAAGMTSIPVVTKVMVAMTNETTEEFTITAAATGTYDHAKYWWDSPDIIGGETDLGTSNLFYSTTINPDSSGAYFRSVIGIYRLYDASGNVLASGQATWTGKCGPSY